MHLCRAAWPLARVRTFTLLLCLIQALVLDACLTIQMSLQMIKTSERTQMYAVGNEKSLVTCSGLECGVSLEER